MLTPMCFAYYIFLIFSLVYIYTPSAQQQTQVAEGAAPAVHMCFWKAVSYAEAKVLRASPKKLKDMCFPVQFVYSAKGGTGNSEVAAPSTQEESVGFMGVLASAGSSNTVGEESDQTSASTKEDSVDQSIQLQQMSVNAGNLRELQVSSSNSKAASEGGGIPAKQSKEQVAAGSLLEDPCPCCYEAFHDVSQVALLRCGHIFCEGCIKDWVCRSSSKVTHCPICRRSFATAAVPESV